ncbi:hypothetical protein OBV_29480 [Oscillibacter valericigenes Sjm18-20]|nr:hypothetical protein OBV_29480 [Oscillibacter valericigenes Sjm18-20]
MHTRSLRRIYREHKKFSRNCDKNRRRLSAGLQQGLTFARSGSEADFRLEI